MATETGTTTTHHVHLRADDPTTEALATFFIREDQQTLREALLTAASLVAVARRFSTWVAANPTPTDLYGLLEVPAGFEYFERTAAVPVIGAGPACHHVDEPPGTEPVDSPHAAIVRHVVEGHTNTINLALAIATAVTIAALVLRAVANYLNLDGLTPWTTAGLGLATTLALVLAFGRHVARRIGRTAIDRITEHDALQAARALRRSLQDSTKWASPAADEPPPCTETTNIPRAVGSGSDQLDAMHNERP